jgi:hypothetical protein
LASSKKESKSSEALKKSFKEFLAQNFPGSPKDIPSSHEVSKTFQVNGTSN